MNTTHSQLQHWLSTCNAPVGPSEAHGLLCGLLCGASPEPGPQWLSELLVMAESDHLLIGEARYGLEGFYEDSLKAWNDSQLSLELLLPDDDEAPLKERAEGLVTWCQGFLYGLGLAGAQLDKLSKEAREGLNDLSEITRLNLASIEEGEAEEGQWMEIYEFTRMVAMLLRDELLPIESAAE